MFLLVRGVKTKSYAMIFVSSSHWAPKQLSELNVFKVKGYYANGSWDIVFRALTIIRGHLGQGQLYTVFFFSRTLW